MDDDQKDDARALAVIELARAKYHRDGEVEIDGGTISEGDDNGAYVQAWVWVGFAGTPFDKGNRAMTRGGELWPMWRDDLAPDNEAAGGC